MMDFSIVFVLLSILVTLVIVLGIKLSNLHGKYCEELRKRKVGDKLLEQTCHLLSNTECSMNVCHCGEEMSKHSVLSNHSPVDMGHTVANRLLEDINAVLSNRNYEGLS